MTSNDNLRTNHFPFNCRTVTRIITSYVQWYRLWLNESLKINKLNKSGTEFWREKCLFCFIISKRCCSVNSWSREVRLRAKDLRAEWRNCRRRNWRDYCSRYCMPGWSQDDETLAVWWICYFEIYWPRRSLTSHLIAPVWSGVFIETYCLQKHASKSKSHQAKFVKIWIYKFVYRPINPSVCKYLWYRIVLQNRFRVC
jgi:hypothetical protein